MPELINTKTLAAEDVPQDRLNDAFLSGNYGLNQGTKVTVVSPEGQFGTVDAAELHSALSQDGYRVPTQSEIDENHEKETYGTGVLNPLKAFTQEALGTATFGGSRLATNALHLTTPESQAALARQNPISKNLGTVVGVGAPLLLGDAAGVLGAPIGAVTKAGTAVETAARGILPEASTFATKALAGGTAKALGSAVEGAAFGAGNLVSEHALGDPDITAEKIASDIGFSSLIGAGLGFGGGILEAALPRKAADIVKGIKEDGQKAVQTERAATEAATGIPMAPADDTLAGSLDAMHVEPEKKASIIEGLQQLKPNADEIKEAGDLIGAPVLEGQISASKHVQDLDSNLSQSPTIVGVKRQQLYQKGYDAVQKAVDSSLGAGTELSEAETGNLVKKGLTEKFGEELAPINKLYSDIKELTPTLPLEEKGLAQVSKDILDIDNIKVSHSSPQYQLAKNVSDELLGIKNVDELKSFRSILNERAYGVPALKRVVGQIQEKLASLEENSIVSFAEKNFAADSEYGQEVKNLISQRKQANKLYSGLREKMSELGDVIGKKKIYGPQEFINFIDDLTPEKLTKKLFAKNNSEFLKFFSEQFPDEFKAISTFEKQKIKSASITDGIINPNKVLKQIDKYSPEVKNLLFTPEEQKVLDASKVWIDSVPKNINPSGTAKAVAYRDYFEKPISAALSNLKDLGIDKALKSLYNTGATVEETDRFRVLIQLERLAQKTTRQIESAAKTAVRAALPTAIGIGAIEGVRNRDTEESREDKIDRFKTKTYKISNIAQNPEDLFHTITQKTDGIYEHAPLITEKLQQVAVKGVNFLASKIPQTISTGPLGEDIEPSMTQIDKFNRYQKAVEKPLSTLKDLEEGTLTREALEALQAVHPSLYQEMKNEVMTLAIKHKNELPYQKKLMLSFFLGQDLDNSTKSESILSNQVSINSKTLKGDAKMAGTPNPNASKLTLSNRTLTGTQRLQTSEG